MIITIREAQEQDYKELMKLYDAFYNGKRNFVSHKEDSFASVLKDSSSYVFVAEEEGKLIGFITGSSRFVVRYPKQIMQLDELFVSVSHRKKGVGGRLMEAIEEKARDLDCANIYIETHTDNTKAHKLYELHGFKNTGIYFKKILV